jgi:hypothetical protein
LLSRDNYLCKILKTLAVVALDLAARLQNL